MRNKIKALKEQRGQLAQQIRELSKSESEWGADERQQWNDLNEQYDSVKQELESEMESSRIAERQLAIDMDDEIATRSPFRVQTETLPQEPTNGLPILIENGERLPVCSRDVPMPLTATERSISVGRVLLSGLVGRNILTDIEKRALDSTSAYGIPEEVSRQWIDLLRPVSVSIAAGALSFNTAFAATNISRLDADVTASWLAELASDSPSDPTISNLKLTPHRLQSTSTISAEAFADSLNASEIIVQSALGAHAVALDGAILGGSGTNQPVGILTDPGVQDLPVTGALTWDAVSDALALLQAANYQGPVNQLALVMSPDDASTLRKSKASTSGTYLSGEGWTSEIRWFVTSALAQGSAILGDFRTILIAQRLSESKWFEAGSDGTYSGLLNYCRFHRLVSRVDAILTRPSQFVKLTGLT